MRIASIILAIIFLVFSVFVYSQVKPATTNCGGTDVSHLNSEPPSTNIAFFPTYLDKLFLNPNEHPSVSPEAEATLGCGTLSPQRYIPIDAILIGFALLIFAFYPRKLFK